MTTDIYILSDKAGDYELAIKLVDLSDDGVIAEASGMVSVSTVEVTNAGGLNTALADNNVKIIKFAGDITLSEQVNIVRDIVIDGQDKQLTGNADLRAFHVNKESIDVTIQNINFDTFLQGTTVNIVGTITIKNNIYTNVHRCIDMNGIGFTSDNVTITENKFNLGDGKRAVSYAVKAAKADIQNILDNNYFKDEDDPDNLIRYYSGRSNVYLINSPIENGTIECDGGVTINVANKEDPYGGDADILGTITVTGEITDEALIAALNTKAKDFVDEITIKDSDSKVYIKSFDGKDTCYYEIENSNGGVEGA